MVAAKRAYLAAYNVVLAFGWCQVLAMAACELALRGPAGVYAAVQGSLKLWQTAALLENISAIAPKLENPTLHTPSVVLTARQSGSWCPSCGVGAHVFTVFEGREQPASPKVWGSADECRGLWHSSASGIVRSPLSATVPQVASRLFVLWGILHGFPEVQGCWQVSTLIVSWSLAEIVCYSYFALKEAGGASPPALQWLRYSAFGALYPTGIASEVALIYLALPHIKTTRRYDLEMPNALNFAFDFYFTSLAALACYIPGAPFMYTYMLAQRRKVLGKAKAA
eukprot:SM000252S09080  [mRNA]  locus=s252:58452:60795:- [translate_table: standard]